MFVSFQYLCSKVAKRWKRKDTNLSFISINEIVSKVQNRQQKLLQNDSHLPFISYLTFIFLKMWLGSFICQLAVDITYLLGLSTIIRGIQQRQTIG